MRLIVFATLFFLTTCLGVYAQEKPIRFIEHKVKKKETLYGLSRQYNVTLEQIKEYNPLVEKMGLKRKMKIRIPVYSVKEEPQPVALDESLMRYLVQAKETKWRLAYRYGITIQELEKLNPQIKEGLKVGQEIVVPKKSKEETLALEEEFNYYKVKPKEGYYRLEKKLGVTQADLILLNPTLEQTGLQEGMVLKISPKKTGNLNVKENLLVEKVNLIDSVFQKKELELAFILPFKLNTIEFDSIAKTKALLSERNLYTIALDFYMGALLAIQKADSVGIKTNSRVFDSENSKQSLAKLLAQEDFSQTDAIIGPLIPANLDYVSTRIASETPVVNPLSSKKVKRNTNVYQTVVPQQRKRFKMIEYLKKVIDSTQNVIVIADSINTKEGDNLLKEFPFAQRIYQKEGGYIVPDVVDSLVVDSLPNKVIFETQNLGFAVSVTSMLNAQKTKGKDVQLFTTLKTGIYDDKNISRKHLGNLGFTYAHETFPQTHPAALAFKEAFQKIYGDFPSKESTRGYDVTLDLILRMAYKENILHEPPLETDYVESRFFYQKSPLGGVENAGLYMLKHQGYTISELKN